MTKLELQQHIIALSAQLVALRTENSMLRTQLDVQRTKEKALSPMAALIKRGREYAKDGHQVRISDGQLYVDGASVH